MSTIGILGGGQLGMMMAQAAKKVRSSHRRDSIRTINVRV
jgi:phosphoribosylaminoimidazole carboxylase (NCAIR synthetase)